MRTRFNTIPRLTLALGIGALMSVCAQAQEVPAKVKEALKRADAEVAAIIKIPDNQRTFDNTLGALDDMSVRLDNETSLPIFMQYVSTDAKVRDDSRAAEEAVSNWQIALGKREDLYRAVKAYAAKSPRLEGEQKRLLEFTLRDYRRAGMELPADKRERVKQIEIELQKLSTQFQTNIYEDETVAFLTAKELKGLPADILKRLSRGVDDLYVVTMDGPTFNAVMDYVEDGNARKKVWYAYKRRGGKRNVTQLEKILKLRAEAAGLLGFKNTVDYNIETRMAKNSQTVAKFYSELRPIVRKKAQLDYNEFVAAKRRHTGDKNAKLYPWDQSYYKQRLLKEKYAIDSQKVAEYFPVDRVFDGLFQITSSLYGIEFKDVTKDAASLGLPIWHEDVKLFAISDKKGGELLGHIYTDLFPRENKYNHAACWGLMARKVWSDGKVQKPLAALVCNFTKPTADKPSLMTHDEVETFFHEFGHGLHQILTETKYGRFSGTAVARDFVEAPSQMFENWVWDPSVLKLFAKHYKTGEVLPAKLLQNMKSAQTLGSGLEAEHQFYYGMVDQAYHTAEAGKVDTTKVGVDLLREVELYEAPVGTYFQSAFGHLMGYEGAYYGYQWSLVYAQDMFQRFNELGILNPEAGQYYRKKILARGGTMDENEMLRDYLGREPNMDAYLRHLGLDPKK
jgi:thimet oligopeptidase